MTMAASTRPTHTGPSCVTMLALQLLTTKPGLKVTRLDEHVIQLWDTLTGQNITITLTLGLTC